MTWWPTVVLGGPVRPTGAALLSRSADGAVTVHMAERLDDTGAFEDEQAAEFAEWVRSIPRTDPATVIIARAAGVGRDLEKLWRDALPRCHVRTFPLPTGDESARAREDLVTAVHMARSRQMFYADDAVSEAVDIYVRQDPAPFGATLNPHDADPDGIAVPIAVAVRYSDPSRQTTIHVAKGVRINRDGRTAQQIADAAAHGGGMIGDVRALISQAEREFFGGSARGPRIRRRHPPL